MEALAEGTKGNWRSRKRGGCLLHVGNTNVGLTPYDLPVRANHVGVKEVLRKHWPKGRRKVSLTDGAVLHKAAEQDNVPTIDFLVGEAGTEVDFRDESGYTALHVAAREGASRAMAALLKHGAAASAPDEASLTPLHHAATGGHAAAIDVLCGAAGVDIDLRVKQSFNYTPECDTWSPLDFAAIRGNVGAFKALVRHGANWKALSEGDLKVLNTAAASNKTELIDVLMGLGAKVDGSGEVSSIPPLHTAIMAYSPDAARALVRHGARLDRKPTPNALFDESALFRVIQWGHLVNLFVDVGVDPQRHGR